MNYQVGDKVFHWNYGLGEVVELDHKVIAGKHTDCYVVQIRDLTLWVPITDNNESSLRLPTSRSTFESLFAILSEPCQPLSEDRFERKVQLQEKMRDGKIETVCEVIRDLSCFQQAKKLNDNDSSVLERARNLLLDEWAFSFSIPVADAERALKQLLEDHAPEI